jgi:hypothetical protein
MVDLLTANGLQRDQYRLFLAHWTNLSHLCGPGTCGYAQADATQWISVDNRYDLSICADDFFGAIAPPAPPFSGGISTASTEDDMADPLVVVAEGPAAGTRGNMVNEGECYVIWPVGTKTLQPLADAVATANFYRQVPLPGVAGCEKRTCAGLAAIPTAR